MPVTSLAAAATVVVEILVEEDARDDGDGVVRGDEVDGVGGVAVVPGDAGIVEDVDAELAACPDRDGAASPAVTTDVVAPPLITASPMTANAVFDATHARSTRRRRRGVQVTGSPSERMG
jgi:hypothetical protein